MIPFLKKNKDGKKPPKPTVPRTAQESVPFQRMFEDGTCRVRPIFKQPLADTLSSCLLINT